MAKYHFKEWLYGPKNKWPEEPPKAKQKKKEMLIYKAPPVKCDYEDRAMINSENTLEFVCPNKHEVSAKCMCWNVELYVFIY